MRLDKLALAFVALVAFAGVVAFVQQQETNAELLVRLEELSRKIGYEPPPARSGAAASPASGAAAPEGSGGSERAELARLRADLSVLKVRTQELALAVKQGPGGAAPLNLVPAIGWKNAGKGSPEAAAESLLWASDSGDLDVLAGSIVLDADAREKAAAILARLPEATRQTYDTPEKLMALLLARDTDARAMQVLGANTAGDDALVSLRLQKDDGKTKDEGYQFRRTADGWRLVVPGKAVDRLGKKLTESPKK
jgi:hypothetical protein